LNDNTAAVLVAHHSNYKIIGFTTEPSLKELSELTHENGLPLLYDQGSGALLDVGQYGLDPEPTIPEALQTGCDVIAFSGDKLLGGPQAGILCGRHDLISQLRGHPLARAVRADKMCLAALAATLGHYLTESAVLQIPVWRMIARSLSDIEVEANSWVDQLREQYVDAAVIDGHSMVGGGSLPGTSLPTKLVAIRPANVNDLAGSLRSLPIPVIGRIQADAYCLDPRTVMPDQAEPLLQAVTSFCEKGLVD
jgi:L-seryl-tRNA(Ser) seleniumtransferase